MIVGPDKFEELWERGIKADLTESEDKKLLIFVSSTEADSVCAVHILQVICKAQNVHYTVWPVTTYSEMEKICDSEFRDTEATRTVMLINCGACENLRELLSLHANTRAIVVDSHRPIHHSYNDAEDVNTVLLHDEGEGAYVSDVPEASPAAGTEEGASDGEASEVDISSDEEDELPKRARTSEDGRSSRGSSPKARHTQERAFERAKRQQMKNAYYQRGSSWGKTASGILFDVAHAINLDDNLLLWFYCVALTDQLLHSRIALEQYHKHSMHLETLANNNSEPGVDGEEDVILIAGGEDGNGTAVRVPRQTLQIRPVDDVRLAMLRHWTLYEAMLYAQYVAVRMHTYNDAGRTKMEDLLVNMGVPLAQSKHSFCNMKPQYQRSLQQKLQENAPQYGLSDVTFRSFQLNRGWSRVASDLTAADAVSAVTALLESPGKPDEPRSNATRFWRAWNALSRNGDEAMEEGFNLAKKLQRCIVQDGGMCFQRHMWKDANKICTYDLSEQELYDRDLMTHPMALTKLAAFFHDAYFQKKKKLKPLVVIGPTNNNGVCLVVGYTGQPRSADNQGNQLGDIFERAAQCVNAEYRHDRFDSAVIEIAARDVRRWMLEVVAASSSLSLQHTPPVAEP